MFGKMPFDPPSSRTPGPGACREYGRFVVGARVLPWPSSAPLALRERPDGPVTATLRGLTPVTIVLAADTKRESNGVSDVWYRVRADKPDAVGWVWGGELCHAAVRLSSGGDWIGLRVRAEKDEPFAYAQRVAPNGRVVGAPTRFRAIGLIEDNGFGYTVTVSLTDHRGLSGVRALVRAGFEYGACDYPSGDILIAVTDAALVVGPRVISSANEQGGLSARSILPSEKGGRPGIVRIDETEFAIDDRGRSKPGKTRQTIWRWNGRRFMLAS